jgi:S-adenosylmethionine:tRNA ribosyltransferase-isomerase
MDLDDLDFDLPEAQIAQHPRPERDGARLLVLDRDGAIAHHTVRDLPELLPPSLFVFNDSRVIPARLHGRKDPSGGKVELLLVERLGGEAGRERWLALGRASKGLSPGQRLRFGDALVGEILGRRAEGRLEVSLSAPTGTIREALDAMGAVPLPPYIRRAPTDEDAARYQTVYAKEEGSVAAPTAGLHFSTTLLERLDAAGHERRTVTLHVGPGTFRPVSAERLEDHRMHDERYEVPAPTAAAVAEARRDDRPVIAVGTTSVRTLEAASQGGALRAGPGRTDLFLRPGSPVHVVEGLLTNFHLPRSTLLALVMTLGGVEPVRRAYAEAVREGYRFYSYGDAMLLRPRRPA